MQFITLRPVTKSDKPRPGTYPFTSGIYPEMYRKRLWTMRQYAGFGSAEESNKRYHYLLERGKQVIVGVNRFEAEEPDAASLQAIDPLAVKAQLRRLRRVKAERSDKDIHRVLESLKIAAQINDNLLPPILDAVRVYATVGEISDALREVFGEYKSK